MNSTQPVPASALPEGAQSHGFYSAQHAEDWPPLPANIYGLDAWSLGDGFYLLDDRSLDYGALASALNASATTTASRSSAAALNVAYNPEAAGRPYLTNLVAVLETNQTVTVSFDIAGGTNFVPYDILASTNVAAPVWDWTWVGIGYTSNHYTFTDQPLDLAFYALGKPGKTMVVGWGNDAVGQCDVPELLTNAVAVMAGGGQSLAVRDDGTGIGWGQNGYGQGYVATNLADIAMLAAGWYHSAAMLTNGVVTAWGYNNPPLGYNLTNVPPDLTNATVISAQALHTLALRDDGTVVAWGYSGGFGETNVPAGLADVVAIAAGYQHNLAVKADGTVVAWGNNNSGQCLVPAGATNVWDVAAGVDHSLALKRDGTVVGWGDNAHGEADVPAGLSNVVAIAAGGDPLNNNRYSLALKSDGTVKAWGTGEVPNQVVGLSNVIAIAAGADHALALRTGPKTPVITLQPADQYQVAGGTVTFTARGEPFAAVRYQWQFENVDIPGATNASLTLTNMQAEYQGAYHVIASNEVGTVVSADAQFYLVTAPTIVSQSPPTNPVVVYQSNVVLSVSTTAPGQDNGFPLTYQWQFNGTNIAGANGAAYTVAGEPTAEGTYSVSVSNAVGGTNVSWTVTLTYEGSYIAPGTLAYYLSTNTAAYANGYTASSNDMMLVTNWTYALYTNGTMSLLTNAVWSTNCWLHGVEGLSATPIGISNRYAGASQLLTMVSPRHYISAFHTGPYSSNTPIAFLDTNNVIHWRTTIQWMQVGTIDDDIGVGILDQDLPSSVGYLRVLPTNWTNYLPMNASSYVQGIGMNQDMKVFGQPTMFLMSAITWDPTKLVPFGLGTNWNIAIRGNDSSDPERLLINNQLVLVSQHHHAFDGPNLAFHFDTINSAMHYLSTNNYAGTDYQLTPISLTNWPTIH